MKYWWQQLCRLSPKFAFFPEATKSWVIVKVSAEDNVKEIFGGSGVQKPTDGKRHLGASLGSNKYKNEYILSKVD